MRKSGETNMPPSWLALICIGQVQEEETKHIKRGSQDGLMSLLWGWHILMPQECAIVCLPNKSLSCNTAPPFQIFASARQNWGSYTVSQHTWSCNLDVTWLKHLGWAPARWKPSIGEAQLSKSAPCVSWTQRKPRAVEVRRSPAYWKPGQKNRNQERAHATQYLISEDLLVGKKSSVLWLEGQMTNKILIPIKPLISCLLKPPVNRWVTVGATEGLRQELLPYVFWKLHYPLHPSSYWPSRREFFGP